MHNDSNPEDWLRGGDLRIKYNADKIRRELEEAEAMLCMIMRKMKAGGVVLFLEEEDFQEAGVTQVAFDAWWSRHEYQDEARRKAAIREKEAAKKKQAILNKLTPEERKILGVK
jgi:hypothetical protein